METSAATSTEAERAAAEAASAEPATVAPEPRSAVQNAVLSATNEVTPKVPQSALNTITGTVRVSVRVTIDKQGAVVDTAPEDGGPSRYFERISVDASRKWTFAPAASEEQRTMLVKFNFTREGVTAHADPTEQRN
jgi:TonB family protein